MYKHIYEEKILLYKLLLLLLLLSKQYNKDYETESMRFCTLYTAGTGLRFDKRSQSG